MCPLNQRIRSCLFGSFGCALGVAGFILIDLVHSGVHCGPLGSLRFVRFIRVCHSGSFASLGCALGVIRVCPGGRWVHSVLFVLVIWFDLVRLIHSGAPLGPLGSIAFILESLGGCLVHSASFVSFGCALGIAGFIQVRAVHSGAP